MAKRDSSGNQIVNGCAPPTGTGNIDLRRQGFTSGSYGAETFADRVAVSPPKDEELL